MLALWLPERRSNYIYIKKNVQDFLANVQLIDVNFEIFFVLMSILCNNLFKTFVVEGKKIGSQMGTASEIIRNKK